MAIPECSPGWQEGVTLGLLCQVHTKSMDLGYELKLLLEANTWEEPVEDLLGISEYKEQRQQ